jgi:CRP-like cAMP-binding protein
MSAASQPAPRGPGAATGSGPEGRIGRCRTCAVRANALFGDLTLGELDAIAPAVPDLRLPPGKALYHEGDQPNALFILRRGLVKQELALADGSYRIVRLARRADLLALESLLASPCDHTAIALTETEVCRVPLPIVRHVMDRRPLLANQMIRHWREAVSRADGWLKHYSTGSGRQRMAHLLLDLARWREEEDRESGESTALDLPTRDDMGAILGITKETASRLLGDFRREGLLTDRGSRRATVDRAGLIRLTHSDSAI